MCQARRERAALRRRDLPRLRPQGSPAALRLSLLTEECRSREVAAEHIAFCPDNIWQGCGDFTMYADGLVGEESWSFWWD
ncbi:DUF4253 domain-containing protein [Actinoallomurus vinaceus]|uniref:DUF4253 domain-containing protein n=1 Tax=Actinoallomurus vinaceus TaxID=1080074 RepID=UPI0031EA6CFE